MSDDWSLAGPRWELALSVTEAIRRRFSADVLAVAVHGDVAHGNDTPDSDVHLVVVTDTPRGGPRPTTRRLDGTVVDIGVIAADEYLRHARTLTTAWPLTADQYLTARTTFDPDDWYDLLRDTHLARLADAGGGEFAALARQAWYHARWAHARARRLASWYETDAALIALADSRVSSAVVEGLLTRTYFRDSADAGRRTGTAALDMIGLGNRLIEQAEELAKRERPVDGTVDDLFE